MKKRFMKAFLRFPKTRQEIRENADRFDTKIRGRRRKLPTSWDDQFVHQPKSWKYTRTTQYRPNDCNYAWHEFNYFHTWRCLNQPEYQKARNIEDFMKNLGCFVEHTKTGIRWFGPEID